MTTYRINLISAGSISLDSIFKECKGKVSYHETQASRKEEIFYLPVLGKALLSFPPAGAARRSRSLSCRPAAAAAILWSVLLIVPARHLLLLVVPPCPLLLLHVAARLVVVVVVPARQLLVFIPPLLLLVMLVLARLLLVVPARLVVPAGCGRVVQFQAACRRRQETVLRRWEE
jgi:hypothetical protein